MENLGGQREADCRRGEKVVSETAAMRGEDGIWSQRSLLRFAEILYKCSLCTTLPSILTSKDTFLSHMRQTHLDSGLALHACQRCDLKFGTEEDLRSHKEISHKADWRDMGNATECESNELSKRENKNISVIATDTQNDISECSMDTGSDESCESSMMHAGNIGQPQSKSSTEGNGVVRWYPADDLTSAKVSLTDSKENLETKFGKYASTIHICDRMYYFCQVCTLKFEKEQQCADHFSSGFHKMKIETFEKAKEVGKYATNCVSNSPNEKPSAKNNISEDCPGSRSRRKRTLPMPCRRESRTEFVTSEESNDVNSGSEPDQAPDQAWSASLPARYSLMQSDRKRLTLSVKENQPKPSPGWPAQEEGGGEIERNTTSALLKGTSSSQTEKRETRNSGDENVLDLSSGNVKIEEVLNLSKVKRELDDNYNETGNETSQEGQGSTSGVDVWRKLFGGFTPYEMPGYSRQRNMSRPEVKVGGGSSEGSAEIEVKCEGGTHHCNQCQAQLGSVDEFCTHYREAHLNTQHTTIGDQQFKVMWLKQLLPQFLVVHESGCVSRDELLDRMSIGVDTSDAGVWGPACNKAVREHFPDSQALRKGKFKKTYYFGVQYRGQHSPSEPVEEDILEEDDRIQPALRNMGQDMERITHHLPELVHWTGHMDSCLTRDALLHSLSARIGDVDVLNWGMQCNRAIRQVYPEVYMKRKGKFKTTCYYGIEMISEPRQVYPHHSRHTPPHHPAHSQSTPWPRASSGPPVVNVLDILEKPGHSHLSRLPRSTTSPAVKPGSTVTPSGGGNVSSTMPAWAMGTVSGKSPGTVPTCPAASPPNTSAGQAPTSPGAQLVTSPTTSGARQVTSPTPSGARQVTSPTPSGARQVTSPTPPGIGQMVSPTSCRAGHVMSPKPSETGQVTPLISSGTGQLTSLLSSGTGQVMSPIPSGTEQSKAPIPSVVEQGVSGKLPDQGNTSSPTPSCQQNTLLRNKEKKDISEMFMDNITAAGAHQGNSKEPTNLCEKLLGDTQSSLSAQSGNITQCATERDSKCELNQAGQSPKSCVDHVNTGTDEKVQGVSDMPCMDTDDEEVMNKDTEAERGQPEANESSSGKKDAGLNIKPTITLPDICQSLLSPTLGHAPGPASGYNFLPSSLSNYCVPHPPGGTTMQSMVSMAMPSHMDNLEKLVLLHPGPFVTARIFGRRFQRFVSCADKVINAMTMLQGRGLGQIFTLKQGNSKVFFKAIPSKSLEVPLSVLGVRLVDYQVMFRERDPKLEDTLHEKLKMFYPQTEVLATFYKY